MEGLALVDTAAQHGLCGQDTLMQHNSLLKHKFGLQVQWSAESGGAVRGVCGKGQHTRVAYVPIGLAGCPGLLKAQVVPGEVPFLLPAHMLTDLKAVIDMSQFVIVYNELCVSESMVRMNTGHVAVNITDFVKSGFRLPAVLSGSSSIQVWKGKPQAKLAEFSVGVFMPNAASVLFHLRWRRLVLRLLYFAASELWRDSLQCTLHPQDRQARRLAQRRALEDRARQLRQRELAVRAERPSSSTEGPAGGGRWSARATSEARPGDHRKVPPRAANIRSEQGLGLRQVPGLRCDGLHARASQGGPSHVERGVDLPDQGLRGANARQEDQDFRGEGSSAVTVDPNAELYDYEDGASQVSGEHGPASRPGSDPGASAGIHDTGGDLCGAGRSSSQDLGHGRRGDDREPVLCLVRNDSAEADLRPYHGSDYDVGASSAGCLLQWGNTRT